MIIKNGNRILDIKNGELSLDKDGLTGTFEVVAKMNGKNITLYSSKIEDKSQKMFDKLISKMQVDADIQTLEEELFPETTLSVTPTSITKNAGEKQVLTINTNAKDFSISTTNSGVASVDKATKTVTAVKQGKATITIKAQADYSIQKTIQIPVTVNAVVAPEVAKK